MLQRLDNQQTLDSKFTMSNETGDMKLLVLIDSEASSSFMSLSVAKHLGWTVRPYSTPFAVQLANESVVHTSGIANGLVSSGV